LPGVRRATDLRDPREATATLAEFSYVPLPRCVTTYLSKEISLFLCLSKYDALSNLYVVHTIINKIQWPRISFNQIVDPKIYVIIVWQVSVAGSLTQMWKYCSDIFVGRFSIHSNLYIAYS
jgi:hypothetical protein